MGEESDWAIDNHITSVYRDMPVTNEQCIAMTNDTIVATTSDVEDERELEGVLQRDSVDVEDARTDNAVVIPVDELEPKHIDIDLDNENSLTETARSCVNNMNSSFEIGDVANRESSGDVPEEEEQDEQHQKKLDDKNFG